MKILLTGFEPFGGETENPSAGIARAAQAAGAELKTLVLPVEFGRAAEITIAALGEFAPDWIIMLGQAAGRTAITPERVAINLAHSTEPDNAGFTPWEQLIDPLGPVGYFSSLPLSPLVGALQTSGVPAQLSNTAGTYVCNDLFYRVMAYIQDKPIKGGFIHIPLFPSQTLQGSRPSMAPDLILRGINTVLSFVSTYKEKNY